LKEGDRNQVVIVISYAHGCKHNASRIKDGDLENFKNVLRQQVIAEEQLTRSLNRGKKEKDKVESRKVIGLYTGWRGALYNYNWLNTLTFWKRTAQLVGLQHKKHS